MKTIILVSLILFSVAFPMTRIQFVDKLIDIYEAERGEIQYADCPFVDGNEVSCKAFSIGITAGTSSTTFSPNDNVEPYQAFLFAGKLLQALGR